MRSYWLFVFFVFCFAACSPTKMVPPGSTLLNKTKLEIEGDVPKEVAANLPLLIKQRPNKRSIKWRSFRLDWYNFLGGDEHPTDGKWIARNWNKVKNWSASTIGSAPVIYQRKYKVQATENMTNYLKSKGYYFATVKDSLVVDTIFWFEKPKVNITYLVTTGDPYKINKIQYTFDDSLILRIIEADSLNRLFKVGQNLDATNLQNERLRITDTLKNRGYYKFAKEYLHYEISKPKRVVIATEDSTKQKFLVDITMKLQPYEERVKGKTIVFVQHPIYRIKNIYIRPNYDPKKAIREAEKYYNQLDTTIDNGVYFLHNEKTKLRYPTVIRGLKFKKGELYNSSLFDKSTQYLNTLSAVKLASTFFAEKEANEVTDTIRNQQIRELDCHLNITNSTKQYYSFDLEGNYASQEYFGLDGSINYRHKNLFRGSEDFNLAFTTSWANNILGNTETIESEDIFNSRKFGVEMSIAIPKFLVPFGFQIFKEKYTPHTKFDVGFSYERRPDFNNVNTQFAYGYRWQTSPEKLHYFNVIDLFATRIINISQTYQKDLVAKNLLADYSDKIIPALSYTFIYNGKPKNRKGDLSYFRLKLESAGNILMSAGELMGAEKRGNRFFKNGEFDMLHIFDFPVSQYIKSEIDWRYHLGFVGGNKLAIRTFAGVGIPYGNFPVMASHKQYMAGGMNSLRGWTAGRVGPGNFPADENIAGTTSTFYQQRGEMKLEMNIEYRQKVADMYELALFFDIGNIWALSENNASSVQAAQINEKLPDAVPIKTQFGFDTFAQQLAYNTGFGLRLDMSFFILRVDFGAKVNDPGDNNAGIFKSGLINKENWRINFGIGHPF